MDGAEGWLDVSTLLDLYSRKGDIIAYIEMCYNSRRKHAYLGDVSPNEYEKCARVA